jgi:tetrahydromethanopterin S-methyltransferase subunit G
MLNVDKNIINFINSDEYKWYKDGTKNGIWIGLFLGFWLGMLMMTILVIIGFFK